jgi:hypothetical protein
MIDIKPGVTYKFQLLCEIVEQSVVVTLHTGGLAFQTGVTKGSDLFPTWHDAGRVLEGDSKGDYKARQVLDEGDILHIWPVWDRSLQLYQLSYQDAKAMAIPETAESEPTT